MLEYQPKYKSGYLSLNASPQGAEALDAQILLLLRSLRPSGELPNPRSIAVTHAGSDRYFVTVVVD